MNKEKEIFILGVGHNTAVYIELAESCGYKICGLYHYNDDRTGEEIHGHKIIGSTKLLLENNSLEDLNFALSMGNNNIRSDLFKSIRSKGGKIPNLIHPKAIVSKYSEIGEGVVIHANSVIQPDVRIMNNSVISYNASISHTSSIGESSYVAFGSCIGAYVKIGNYVLVGQASSIVSGKVEFIGDNSIIGAGSVVIQDVESNSIVAGNPAKLLKKIM